MSTGKDKELSKKSCQIWQIQSPDLAKTLPGICHMFQPLTAIVLQERRTGSWCIFLLLRPSPFQHQIRYHFPKRSSGNKPFNSTQRIFLQRVSDGSMKFNPDFDAWITWIISKPCGFDAFLTHLRLPLSKKWTAVGRHKLNSSEVNNVACAKIKPIQM